MKTCYMCDAPSVPGKGEHVPPRCLFPDNPAYRKQLVRVPSCDAHNLNKSKTDEYVKFVLAAAPGTNELASQLIAGSVMRSFDYRPHLIDRFMRDLQPVFVGKVETGGFKLDRSRFEQGIACIVRGIFFHETGKKLLCDLRVGWAPMLIHDFSKAPFLEPIRNCERTIPASYVGANPKVFQYAFNRSTSGGTVLCRLRFYEGHPVYATWRRDAGPGL